MNYWNELTGVEDQLIELEILLGAVRLICNGVSSSNLEDTQNALWMIERSLESISKTASERFQFLWETVREDSFKGYGTTVSEDAVNELNGIVNNWIKK